MSVDADFFFSRGRQPWESSNSSRNESDGLAVCWMMGEHVFLPFSVLNVFGLLPVCCCVLFLGFRRAKRRRDVSHADFITYQVVFVELFGILGTTLYTSGLIFRRRYVRLWGMFFITLVFAVQTLFHCLACVERYIAVVHPVSYMSVPKVIATRIRNGSAACIWFTGLTWTLVVCLIRIFPMNVYFAFLSWSLALVVYCSVAVLRVLIRPGLKDKIDQTKRRAFKLILLILLVLLFRFGGFVASYGFIRSAARHSAACVVLNLTVFLLLPGSFLLPLLFLQREGRLNRREITESEMKTVVSQQT